MNILNREQFIKHMSPENNYLSTGSIENIHVELVVSTDYMPNLEVKEKEAIGRGQGNGNIPDFLRSTIASLAHETSGTKIAEAFDVSKSVVSQAKHGRISHDRTDESLKQVVTVKQAENKTKQDEIHDEALIKTLASLNMLTLDDISLLGAKDKADVAVKLSKVADNIRDKKADVVDNRVQFVIMAPSVRENVAYDEIDV